MSATAVSRSPVAELIDRILSEGPIGMAQAARLLGTFRDGKPAHPSTPTRWATAGVPLAGGRRLYLEAVRCNGRFVTSKAALVRFLEAQQGRAHPPSPPAPRSPAARSRASENAAKSLAADGW